MATVVTKIRSLLKVLCFRAAQDPARTRHRNPPPRFLPEPMHKPLRTLTKFPLAFRPQVKLPEVPPPTEGQDRRPTVRNRKPQDQDLITSRQKHRIEIKKLPAPTAASQDAELRKLFGITCSQSCIIRCEGKGGRGKVEGGGGEGREVWSEIEV